MTAALNIPENYAEELPKTIAELKTQQKYFNQLEIAAKKIQEATDNYNKLLEQWLTAIHANNIDYTWENTEVSENEQQVENIYSQEEIEENQYNQDEEIETQDSEETPEKEEQTETNEYSQQNDEEIEKNNNEDSKEETEEELQTQWQKINLNSLLNKDDNE